MKKKEKFLEEYYNLVAEVLDSAEFQKRKDFPHHDTESVYDHSLRVSIKAYHLAKKFNLDYKSAAIGGLLHDFYSKPWQTNFEKKAFLKKHGFTHAKEALENARIYFPHILNKKIENSILRHMFPLNKIPPKYKESWIVNIADKYVSLSIFKKPTRLYRYIGIKGRSKNNE